MRFMNSSTINNNHIYIMVMDYTTPETSKGVDMTFWGWMWMYMQGDGSNIFVESCLSFRNFFASLSPHFFFFCSKTSTAFRISEKKENLCLPNGRCLSIPLHNQPLHFPCCVWNIYQRGMSRNKNHSIFTLNMALYIFIKPHTLLLFPKKVSLGSFYRKTWKYFCKN